MNLFFALALALSMVSITGNTASASTGAAAAVHACTGLDSIGNLIGNVKQFAQGAISVAYVSTEEPAAAPDHLLIFVADGEMGSTCYAVSESAEGHGFAGVDMAKLTASYDSVKGLLLSVPVSVYDADSGRTKPAGAVKIRVSRKNNQSSVVIE